MEEENGTRINHKRASQSIPFSSQKHKGKQMKSDTFFQKWIPQKQNTKKMSREHDCCHPNPMKSQKNRRCLCMCHFSNCTCAVHSKMPIHKTSSFITKSRVVYSVFDMKSKRIAKLWNVATNLRKWVRPNSVVNQANQSKAESLNREDFFLVFWIITNPRQNEYAPALYYIILQYFSLLSKILGNFCYLKWDFTISKLEKTTPAHLPAALERNTNSGSDDTLKVSLDSLLIKTEVLAFNFPKRNIRKPT